MSTRAQLVVETNEGIKIYKHCDGYPSGVLPILKKLLPKFKAARGFDAEYLTAHLSAVLIQNSITSARAFYRRMKKKFPTDPTWANLKVTQEYLGHGLDTKWHGDIEFAYRIKPDFSVEVWNTHHFSKSSPLKTWTLEELGKTRKFE